ncbi:MAG: hypothetical protein ACLR8L_06755 [Oscillospiraceae bacterium]
MLSGRGADRGQPHDAGQSGIGPLAYAECKDGTIRPGYAGKALPELYPKTTSSTRLGGKRGFAHRRRTCSEMYRRLKSGGRVREDAEGEQAALRLDRAAHPHDAALAR